MALVDSSSYFTVLAICSVLIYLIQISVNIGHLTVPVVLGGATAAVAGAATSAVASIIGHLTSTRKLWDAQMALDADRELVKEIKRIKSDTSPIESSKTTEHERQVCSALTCMSSTMSGHHYAGNFPNTIALCAVRLITLHLLKQMADCKSWVRILVSVTWLLIVSWDVVNLVETSIDLNKGSKTAAAASLRQVVGKHRKQINQLEKQDYERPIRKTFRKLLEKISMRGHVEDAEKNEVCRYVENCCSPEWLKRFQVLVRSRDSYAFELSRIFHIFGEQIEMHLSKKEDKSTLTITVIAHGNIDTSVMLPSQFYYMNSHLKTVTLYEPWGCAIDVSVVYGIATNTIRIQNVSYSGEVTPVIPARPLSWNILPSSGPTVLIPTPTFLPVDVGGELYEDWMRINGILQGVTDGLVIPYFTGDGNDILPLPSVPLWVVTHVTAICAMIFNIEIHFRYAACLTVTEPSRETGHVQCSQYCTVDATSQPPVMMTNHFNEAERIQIEGLIENLNFHSA